MKYHSAGLIILFFCSICCGDGKPLKEVFYRDFQVGAALGERYLFQPYKQNEKALRLLAREFNCVTSENLMKPASLRPGPGKFNFDRADQFVKLAEKLDLDIVGHVLVWHAQTPDWFFEDEDGRPLSREALIERMEDHIHKVVRRYKGHVKYWDVVNEAVDVIQVEDPEQPLNPDGSPRQIPTAIFRKSKWLEIIGEDFIELAFKFAHKADPNAILVYNDYGMTDPVKVDFVVKNIVRPLKRKGVRIHAVGMQGHWHVEGPTPEEIKEAIEKLAAAKVKVHITELDLSVLPLAYGYTGADISKRYELQDELNPYREAIPIDVAQKQAERYRAIFDIFESHKRDVERVTFWGICDGDSWKNGFPVRGRTDYPLLFDRNYDPKPAHEALVNK